VATAAPDVQGRDEAPLADLTSVHRIDVPPENRS